jgi:DNA-binding NarL/FixJ family response regulator
MSVSALTAAGGGWYTGVVGGGPRVTPRARVLVVSGLSLFGEGIEGLLRQEPGLEIVALETDPAQAIERIKETHPDVVVLTDAEAATGLGLELLGMVSEGFHMRLVEVHRATNTLCVYSGEQQPIREVGDLVDAVRRL